MSMLRRGGKRICMDEPPPDYDPQTPMTPMVESDGYAYTPYAAQPQTPMTSTGVEGYGEAFVAYESNASSVTSPSHLEVGAPGHFSTPYVEHAMPTGGNPYAQPQHQEFEVPAQPVHRGRGRPKGSKNKNTAASAASRSASPGSAATTTSPRRGAAVAAKQAISAAASAASEDTTERSQTTQNTPRKRGRPRKYPLEAIAEDESSLYNIVRNGRAALQQLVDDWIESYKVNRDSALLTLMQFFISASGCKGKITPEMQATMEHAAIIRKMTEEFDEESGEYPLIMAGQQWKKFKSSFCEFVQVLVKQCQYSIIYDQYLMDNLISLLTGLSDSQVRAFRHTATLAAMKLMTALVDVALTVSVYLDNTQRQYETERQKARDKRATDRLESLKTKHQELEENMDEIKNMLTFTFKSVFVHRYRDTLPEIRAICMAEIGIWMKKFSQSFLDDSYLKYIGWTLHDKVGDVRLKCLQALQPLYADENLKGKLELFTSKFKDRIVSMTLDKEFDVAVQAVRLVISILKYHRDILTDKDCESIYELVFSSHRAVAQAAGEFLNERLLFLPEEGTPEPTRTRRGKKRLPNTPHIRDLLQFFIESELHEHAAYLVDSLIDSNDMLKDWECMTDLLLEEPGPEEEPMDDRQESSLIEIMVCAVKQAATGDPPVGRGPNKKTTSAKEAKQVQEDKIRLTEHFIQALPPLLAKYKPDAEKVANLLTIPQHFELEIYTTSRQPKALDDLLANLKSVVEMHSAAEVLEVAAKTLEVLCEDHAMLSHCDILRSALLDGIVTRFKDALDDYMGIMEEEDPNEDEVFALKSNIRRVAVFYSCHDMGPWDIWDTMFKLIADWSKSLPEEVVKHCMTTCYYGILWELRHLEHASDRTTTAAEQQKKLRDKLDTYIPLMTEIVKTSDIPLFREEAFLSICDLLVVFSRQLDHNPLLRSLIYECDPALQQTLNLFIQTYVFVDDDEEEQDEHTKIEELHKRRNFLACYCKLVVYNIISVRCAADIFKHYVKHYNNYGDIIKTTLGKAREINKTNCARTMVLSLIMLFKTLQREQPRMDRQSQDFIDIKEVAKRFALSFGLDALKNREAVAALHREGILFSINPLENPNDPTGAPPHLPFLEILAEFTNKLLKQDKRVVMAFLDKRITMGMPSSRNEDWQPLLLYRNSLLHGEGDAPSQPSKKAYSRRKKEEDGAGADEAGDEGDEAGSDQEF